MQLKSIIEKLTGQEIPFTQNEDALTKFDIDNLDLGYSQFNELLLYLGYDRINKAFFQFLCDGTTDFKNPKLTRLIDLDKWVTKCVEMSLRYYGNLKFAYQIFSSIKSENDFIDHVINFQPGDDTEFKSRHDPFFKIVKIPTEKTFFLGYMVQAEIKNGLKSNPTDEALLKMVEEMNSIIKTGNENHNAYLASDHLDVYVATSMRHKHEFIFISRTTDFIFNELSLKDLNIRWFDPTQAYCSERIDKGISEALMLKRAKCTIYLAQESDTLGKDSELASTLAQGKTVIAYVPLGDKDYVDNLITDLESLYPLLLKKELIIEQLKIFDPELCWTDNKLRSIIDDHGNDYEYVLDLLYKSVKKKYDSRAKTLKDLHPLGIQVNLQTGVANGVIVTQDLSECAQLVRKVLLKELEFIVDTERLERGNYVYLKESITKSIYRVASGDPLLTNTFWNYYIN